MHTDERAANRQVLMMPSAPGGAVHAAGTLAVICRTRLFVCLWCAVQAGEAGTEMYRQADPPNSDDEDEADDADDMGRMVESGRQGCCQR